MASDRLWMLGHARNDERRLRRFRVTPGMTEGFEEIPGHARNDGGVSFLPPLPSFLPLLPSFLRKQESTGHASANPDQPRSQRIRGVILEQLVREIRMDCFKF